MQLGMEIKKLINLKDWKAKYFPVHTIKVNGGVGVQLHSFSYLFTTKSMVNFTPQ
jgi:hypothetical protein